MAVHCPECGFANPEGANYCQKCGAYLGRPARAGEDPTTMTYTGRRDRRHAAGRHRRGGRGRPARRW